ncbi:hypothetical protein I204_02022 [Kwoniella mangroviensis CBS 8886]|uniref:uncharacterized protein n=1 Tax=Kwoniella mangroviensis CBS 8507 TaxID=1296122 RepID=UPI00080CDED9|nr:uncharacterized protein I203_03672 [Kwoniella mangroviensis CBS 8507]OCF66990.1 hypothetical protein I203_03672 [Kwoniella mangroviensis CBS 8507]OCF78016.1 hypothetical protein I204_02022 [Kwoniella mangroviensis CBS 8886]
MSKQPNFLVILADDLGFSDIGAFGSEISTPNLDKLAKNGLRQTGFHTASACSPTRSMLMSGTDNHLAGLGQMAETIARDSFYQGHKGYEGMLNDRVAALPEILSDAGYETIMSGKWHLGLPKHAQPHARGFQKVFGLLPGAGNHYLYEPFLDDNTPAMKFLPPLYVDGPEQISHKDIPGPFYSSTYFTDRMLGYLKERNTEKPFFAYLPYTAPHWPLQAPDEEIAKYKGRYDAGPEALRLERLERLKQLGLISKDVSPHPIMSPYGYKSWDELSPEERAISAKKMEVYAAMVTVMDKEIGRVIQLLEDRGELENTFVFFSSDNGAEGALLEAIPVMGDQIKKTVEKFFDNSIENIGRGNSWTYLGPHWGQAATAPSKMYKAWATEGGIRCPSIIHYPKLGGLLKQDNAVTHEFTTIMDILPTVLDLAGIQHPGNEFRGRKVHKPRGKSWTPWLSGQNKEVHDENAIHGWELFGQAAIRQGRWKAVWLPPPTGKDQWLLFDLDQDPGETKDLAEAHPEKLQQLVAFWHEYEAETGTIVNMTEPSVGGFGRSTGINWDDWGH